MKYLIPSKKDPRDYHFHKTFGAVFDLPASFKAGNSLFPDQDQDGRPTECTAYLCSYIAGVQDNDIYSSDFNYMKTLEVMDVPPDSQGADLRTAVKIGTTFGFLPGKLEPDGVKNGTQAWAANQANWPLSLDTQTKKKATYFSISPMIGQDWFDAIRSAVFTGNTPVGAGTQWSPDFENIGQNPTLPDSPTKLYWGHAYSIEGWDGEYLFAKTWQGASYGEAKMSRTLINNLMKTWGTYAFTFSDKASVQQKEFNLLQVLIALFQNLIHGTI